ncbi:MAG: type II toxin-antitoxin system antitoxin, RelB/DinJ family, partial [Lachnospiraceae bacterium]|nr:type II toxin-antitoxin system antitoxin, RelB/DinJ family [Lachnospiraceae bacterium]
QIVLVKGMPFQSKLPETTLFSAKDMSRTDFDQALQKGIDSIEAGKTHSVQEVDEMLAQEFGI